MEDLGHLIGGSLFVAAWVAGVVSWFLAVVESIGMWRFNGWVFRSGLTVLNDQRILPNPKGRFPVGDTVESANGKFYFVAPTECFFRNRLRLFGFQMHTPFPLKGTISWSGDQAQIKGRTPIFTFVFMGAWLVGWVSGSLMMIAAGQEAAKAGIPFLFFGIAIAGGMVALSLPLEKRRLNKLVQELESLVTAPAA